MGHYTAIQRSTHKSAGYTPSSDLGFASNMTTVPLLCEELPLATQHMATGFQTHKHSTAGERFELIGIQSVIPNKNLFVLPNGKWIGGYKPAFYRAHPFALINNPQSQEVELSISDDCIVDNARETDIPFFDSDGNLTEQLRETASFLAQTLHSRGKTQSLCRELQEAGLITPWAIKFSSADKDSDSQTHTLQGLSRIDENALQTLDREQLAKLNQSGALKLAYTQLLSQPRISGISTLIAVQQKLDAAHNTATDTNLDDIFNENDELFSF